MVFQVRTFFSINLFERLLLSYYRRLSGLTNILTATLFTSEILHKRINAHSLIINLASCQYWSIFYAIKSVIRIEYSIGLATKWLRILSLGVIDKIRNHLVANAIWTTEIPCSVFLLKDDALFNDGMLRLTPNTTRVTLRRLVSGCNYHKEWEKKKKKDRKSPSIRSESSIRLKNHVQYKSLSCKA